MEGSAEFPQAFTHAMQPKAFTESITESGPVVGYLQMKCSVN